MSDHLERARRWLREECDIEEWQAAIDTNAPSLAAAFAEVEREALDCAATHVESYLDDEPAPFRMWFDSIARDIRALAGAPQEMGGAEVPDRDSGVPESRASVGQAVRPFVSAAERRVIEAAKAWRAVAGRSHPKDQVGPRNALMAAVDALGETQP